MKISDIGTALSGAWKAISAARNAILTGMAVAGLCLPLGYCAGQRAEKARNEAARALANIEALQVEGAAAEKAAADRVEDALAVERHEQELIDAISKVPDGPPDDVRVALGCQRLRAQGTAAADLPEICRS